jgi:hypothetical protein
MIVAGGAGLLAPGGASAGPPPLMITEVLFHVPPEPGGDANADGVRHATGDEFIEVANPRDEPVNLKGYVLYSRRAGFARGATGGVRFEFPECVLPPHAVCVVFNGCDSAMAAPVGTERAAPSSGHAGFNGVMVFSMENRAKPRALSNSGDWIVLASPDGTILDGAWWGEPTPPPPEAIVRHRVEENPKGSVQRLTPEGTFEAHPSIDGAPFSPGVIPRRGAK